MWRRVRNCRASSRKIYNNVFANIMLKTITLNPSSKDVQFRLQCTTITIGVSMFKINNI